MEEDDDNIGNNNNENWEHFKTINKEKITPNEKDENKKNLKKALGVRTV